MFFVPIVLLNLFFVYIRTCAIVADTCVVANGLRISYLTCNSNCTILFRHSLRRVRKIAKSDCYLSVRPSVLPSEWYNSAPTGWIFHEILHLNAFRKSVDKIQVSLKSDKNNRQFTRRRMYSRTPLIRINWNGEPSGYAENPDI